jgi:hypothetical protein
MSIGMAETPRDWRFPTICPRCLAKAGNPVRVAASPETEIVVQVRCERCEFGWHIAATTPPLFLKPKSDRRADK